MGMVSMQGSAAGLGLFSNPRLPRPSTFFCHHSSLSFLHPPEDPPKYFRKSTNSTEAELSDIQTCQQVELPVKVNDRQHDLVIHHQGSEQLRQRNSLYGASFSSSVTSHRVALNTIQCNPGEAWVQAAQKLGTYPSKGLRASPAGSEARAAGVIPLEDKPMVRVTPSSEDIGGPYQAGNMFPEREMKSTGFLRNDYHLKLSPKHSNLRKEETKDLKLGSERTKPVQRVQGPVQHQKEARIEVLKTLDVMIAKDQLAGVHAKEAEVGQPPVNNDKVMVIDSVAKAEVVVEQLMGEYKDLVHACDTEVAGIDVKKESPVGHGRITCLSIYCGPSTNFGEGKNRLWVDVLDGGEEVLSAFRPYFESPLIKKVWHNYSFDRHVLSRHGIHSEGFYADTMHLARLWDSARRGTQGGYSLEALTSDKKLMTSYAAFSENDEPKILAGKQSMKDLFGKPNMRKDGTEGKLKVIPPVEELQRGKEWRELWIHYSAFDAVCTWRLWQSLQDKLKKTRWSVVDFGEDGSMYDFYEKYWQPFGELLVQMEAKGMLVDCNHLAEVEKIALGQQQISVSRFRKWAAKYCPDAIYMNVGSDAQIRQLLFGGTSNRRDSGQVLPMERVFNVPNTDGHIEEGKKVPKKTRPIVIRALEVNIPIDTYTCAGWPAVGGAALKALAGKIAMDYTLLDAEAEDEDLIEISTADEGVLTSEGIKGNKVEDFSVYGKAYAAFGGGEEGQQACMALTALCEVASINTLISNFIQPLQGGDIKSEKDGRVHCSLNINTETGRLSARRPSLQNQPALEKDRYKIRQAFVAGPGKSLIVADYGQLELRILAHLAKCRSMKDAFIAGGDFHSRTAMNMYGHVRDAVEKGTVLLEWDPQPGEKKSPVPLLKDMFASERRKAKMLNFSIAYGKTAQGLSKDWKVSLDEAKSTLDLWYRDRPEVMAWQKERIEEAHRTLHVRTLLGRTRHLPDINSFNAFLRSHMERAAINTPVQGSAADVAMCAMLEINCNETLRELGWKLLLQVHDEVILEGPTESVQVAKDLVVHAMMHPFSGRNFLDVALAVDADYASNWYAAK